MDKLFMTSGVLSLLKPSTVVLDNAIFRLHYRVTTLALCVACLMVTGTQFFGNPIYCIVQGGQNHLEKVVRTYCWIESTFSLPKAWNSEVGTQVVYPGVDKYDQGDDIIEHAYYQWVFLVLLLQACMFRVPRMIWKNWEAGRVKNLLQDLHKPFAENRVKKYEAVVTYFIQSSGSHDDYLLKFSVCELLNFVNVIGQIFLVDKFLHDEFSTFGIQVFNFLMKDQQDRNDPMVRVFPRLTKCTFYHYGPSGDVQKADNICILPLNILNEKIYVFLWFWFVLLAILSGLAVGFRLTTMLLYNIRRGLLKFYNKTLDSDNLDVLEHFTPGDWFLLYMLGNNMSCVHFKEVMDKLAEVSEGIDQKV